MYRSGGRIQIKRSSPVGKFVLCFSSATLKVAGSGFGLCDYFAGYKSAPGIYERGLLRCDSGLGNGTAGATFVRDG
jgi:hypothetical protein